MTFLRLERGNDRKSAVLVKAGDFGTQILQKIAELEARSGVKLDPVHKVFLAETGTMEQLLSVLAGSQIKVRVVEQKELRGRGGGSSRSGGNNVIIVRESLLLNADTGEVLLRARSKIFARNLPARVVSQVRRRDRGIGTIISGSRLETFRKIIEIGYDQTKRSAFRKYRIVHKGRVAFEIEEEMVSPLS